MEKILENTYRNINIGLVNELARLCNRMGISIWEVVDAAKYLHKAGVPVVLITDTGLSPAHPYADLSFHCTMTSSYYFPSFTGCLALINTICRAAGATRNKETVEYTRKLERELLDRGIFL